MRLILAVDAGGTRSRAAVFDSTGLCLGFGRGGAGNPTSAGITGAVSGIADAAEGAMRWVAPDAATDGTAAIALAGEETAAFHDAIAHRLTPLGIIRVDLVPDLLGMFHSGTPELDGYALISGTGAVAARVAGGRLQRTAGGAGWLLGDAGSGFWIGHRIARAVVADLDGSGPSTALTDLVLGEIGIERTDERENGSVRSVRRLVSALYAARPVELARFAPLVFASTDDAVADRIIAAASTALAALLDAVRDDDVDQAGGTGLHPPVIIGGSVLVEGMRLGRGNSDGRFTLSRHPLFSGKAPVAARDGLLGAAVLAFRAASMPPDAALFERMRSSLVAIRSSATNPP